MRSTFHDISSSLHRRRRQKDALNALLIVCAIAVQRIIRTPLWQRKRISMKNRFRFSFPNYSLSSR